MILIVNSDVTVAALRLARPFGRANRATSSKPARFIRHWRRFADFHVRQKKRLSARKRARLRRVRCRGLQSPSKSGSAAFLKSISLVENFHHVRQRAVTAGQAVVFYNGEEVLGGGTIEKAL